MADRCPDDDATVDFDPDELARIRDNARCAAGATPEPREPAPSPDDDATVDFDPDELARIRAQAASATGTGGGRISPTPSGTIAPPSAPPAGSDPPSPPEGAAAARADTGDSIWTHGAPPPAAAEAPPGPASGEASRAARSGGPDLHSGGNSDVWRPPTRLAATATPVAVPASSGRPKRIRTRRKVILTVILIMIAAAAAAYVVLARIGQIDFGPLREAATGNYSVSLVDDSEAW